MDKTKPITNNLQLLENYIKKVTKKDTTIFYYRIYTYLSTILIIILLGIIFNKG